MFGEDLVHLCLVGFLKQFLEGKEKVIGFFVGQIMRETKGKANPQAVNEILRKKLLEQG